MGLAFDKTGIALPANLSLTCAPRRADGGRAEVARQAQLCQWHAIKNWLTRLYSHTLTHRIVTASECEIGLAAGG